MHTKYIQALMDQRYVGLILDMGNVQFEIGGTAPNIWLNILNTRQAQIYVTNRLALYERAYDDLLKDEIGRVLQTPQWYLRGHHCGFSGAANALTMWEQLFKGFNTLLAPQNTPLVSNPFPHTASSIWGAPAPKTVANAWAGMTPGHNIKVQLPKTTCKLPVMEQSEYYDPTHDRDAAALEQDLMQQLRRRILRTEKQWPTCESLPATIEIQHTSDHDRPAAVLCCPTHGQKT